MSKKVSIHFLTLIVLVFAGYNSRSGTPALINNPAVTTHPKDSIPSTWKTYTNKNLGISFQYPGSWLQLGNESKSVNRSGGVMSISISFMDTITQSTLFIEYHLPPYGAELFKNSLAEFNSSRDQAGATSRKTITVAGSKALETISTMTKDIKGNIYDPPLTIIQVVFLDKQQTGEFHLRFKTPIPNSGTESHRLNQLLSTIEFLQAERN